jgi:uncharacterized protein
MIKFLWILVLLLLLCVVFMSRSSRKASNKPAGKHGGADRPAIEMLPCRWCSVHVPAGDAVRGKHGAYCSVAHQQKAEP